MADLTPSGALLAETYGLDALAYFCGTDRATVLKRLDESTSLSEARESVLGELLGLASHLTQLSAEDNVPVAMRLDVLGRFHEETETSIGNALRLRCGGEVSIESSDEPVERELLTLLRDAYPLLLMPIEDRHFPRPQITSALWSNPARKRLDTALLDDPDLSQLFPTEREGSGWSGNVMRSTGSGGGVQLWTFPELIITGTWWRGHLDNDLSLGYLREEVLRQARLLRRATRGEACSVQTLLAFTGLVLEEGTTIRLPFGSLREVTESERELSPGMIEGGVTHTTAEGEAVTATYSGDVVLESEIEYRIDVQDDDAFEALGDWPDELRAFDVLGRNIDSLRLAVLLSGDDESPLQLAPTWRMVFDPLSWGPLQSWNDPRHGPSIAPRLLARTDDVERWTAAIHEHRRPSIDVAIRRTISASTHRMDQVDALVDLVIAWENLFGSRKGEPTLRISASLAWLLGSDPESREVVRAQVVKIYALRSDIVHGNREVKPAEAAASLQDARRLTLEAWRRLFADRADLLALRNGDERSRDLMMGGTRHDGDTRSPESL